MKKMLFVLLLTAAWGCARDPLPVCQSSGTITGRDMDKCACCWGWIIQIGNSTFKFDRIPAGSNIDLANLVFPAPVRIQWRDAQGACSGRLIEVISISRL